MARYNTNTPGLIPVNQMSYSDSTVIQCAGGTASAEKRRTVRKIRDIIDGVRQSYDVDPVEQAICDFFVLLVSNDKLTVSERIKALEFIRNATDERLNAQREQCVQEDKTSILRANIQHCLDNIFKSQSVGV